MDTGKRIKQLRINKGLTQEELGNLVGVKKAAIQKYENGTVSNLKRTMIKKLAEALDSTPIYILGLDEEVKEATQQIREASPSLAKATKLYMKLKTDEDAIYLLESYYSLDDSKKKIATNLIKSLLDD